MLIGTSLKMYFSHARTVEWVEQVAEIVREHPAVSRNLVTTFVIPQYPSIPASLTAAEGTRILIGAQDIATEDSGAYTGEVSGAVLAELGCKYVEVGHAERRKLFGETDDIVADKVNAGLRSGLTPILCIGEAERVSSKDAILECIRQIESGFSAARCAGAVGNIVIAYEPLWAIGAPQPASAQHIREVCGNLREYLYAEFLSEAKVIYGGSAGPGLLGSISDSVDGMFLGRFAHEPRAFGAILDEAQGLLCENY